jgi:hypothetical protein
MLGLAISLAFGRWRVPGGCTGGRAKPLATAPVGSHSQQLHRQILTGIKEKRPSVQAWDRTKHPSGNSPLEPLESLRWTTPSSHDRDAWSHGPL